MKRMYAFAFLMLVAAGNAFAYKPASENDIKAIRDQIVAANRMDTEVGAANDNLNLAISKKGRADKARKGESSGAKPEDFLVTAESIKELRRIAQNEKDRQIAAYEVAVYMTIRAYGLEPKTRMGASVMQWTKGRTIEWFPVVREPERHELTSATGKTKTEEQVRTGYYGITYFDGVTFIDPKVFRDVRFAVPLLAATVYHESVHFEQYTTDGNLMSGNERELAAFDAEKNFEDACFDKARAGDLAVINEREQFRSQFQIVVAEEKRYRATLRGMIDKIINPPVLRDFDFRPRSDEERAAVAAEAAGASALADAELELAKAKAAEAFHRSAGRSGDLSQALDEIQRGIRTLGSRHRPEPMSEPVAMQPKLKSKDPASEAPHAAMNPNSLAPEHAIEADYTNQIKADFEVMRRIGGEVCGNPGGLTEGRLKEFGDAWRSWQDKIRGTDRYASLNIYESMAGCPLTVLTAILTRSPSGTPGSVADRDWVVQTVYAYNASLYSPPTTHRSPIAPESHDISGEGKARDQAKGIKAGRRGWDKP